MTADSSPPEAAPAATSHSWTQAWLIGLTQPNLRSYTALADDPSASAGKAFAWVFVSGLVASGIASLLQLALISSMLSGLKQSSDTSLSLGLVALVTLVCVIPLSAALASVGLMIYAGIEQLVAGALGGEGSFARLYYVMAAYTAPISLGAALLAIIPFLGACVGALLGFYALGLNVLALKSVNRFGWGSAVLSMIIPLIFIVLIFVIVFFGLVYPALPTLIPQPPG